MAEPNKWRGVFVIVPTPFHDDLTLDLAGLRRVVRFCVACGAHGVVAPAVASEQPFLSDAERRQVVEVLAEEARGRATVIAGVTATNRLLAADLARHAEAAGADAVMAQPPYVGRAGTAEIKDYYRAIDEAGSLPVWVQNYNGPGGTPMSAGLVGELVRELPDLRFVKEETELATMTMTAITAAAGPALEGIMGGKGGRQLPEEYRRGACGTMPSCQVTEIYVAIWNALEAGDWARARDIHRRLLPLLMFETSYGMAVYKEILRRRGVIGSAAYRMAGGVVVDAPAQAELGDILAELEPLLNPDYPVQV